MVFSVQGLTKTYDVGEVQVQALRGVNLEIGAGELAVILGPSGSGKSTLMNILGGLDSPSSGTFRYRGCDLGLGEDEILTQYRRQYIGFVFQFYNLIPSLTARENAALAGEIARQPMAAEDALALVGLSDRMDHFPTQLSGGQQQRVAIARAIVKRPDVLLCDEPTGALDVATGRLVLEVLDRINRELGTTTVIITHNAVIAEMADHILMFADGRIIQEERRETRTRADQLSW
jgi:putative ABC transport system ATP-binding protein